MSASLVGSEMCIRDRTSALPLGAPWTGSGLSSPPGRSTVSRPDEEGDFICLPLAKGPGADLRPPRRGPGFPLMYGEESVG
eukprot:12726755-Alexandrium_andersonii.AAC.1